MPSSIQAPKGPWPSQVELEPSALSGQDGQKTTRTARVRRAVLVDGMSRRSAAQELGAVGHAERTQVPQTHGFANYESLGLSLIHI